MNTPTPERLAQFLERLGQRCPFPAEVYLFGGSALLLIGRRRNTADVDLTLHTAPDRMEELRQAIATLESRYEEPKQLRRNFEEMKRGL